MRCRAWFLVVCGALASEQCADDEVPVHDNVLARGALEELDALVNTTRGRVFRLAAPPADAAARPRHAVICAATRTTTARGWRSCRQSRPMKLHLRR